MFVRSFIRSYVRSFVRCLFTCFFVLFVVEFLLVCLFYLCVVFYLFCFILSFVRCLFICFLLCFLLSCLLVCLFYLFVVYTIKISACTRGIWHTLYCFMSLYCIFFKTTHNYSFHKECLYLNPNRNYFIVILERSRCCHALICERYVSKYLSENYDINCYFIDPILISSNL